MATTPSEITLTTPPTSGLPISFTGWTLRGAQPINVQVSTHFFDAFMARPSPDGLLIPANANPWHFEVSPAGPTVEATLWYNAPAIGTTGHVYYSRLWSGATLHLLCTYAGGDPESIDLFIG